MYLPKFSLPIKGMVNTSRTLGKCQIKMNETYTCTFQNLKIKMQQRRSVLLYNLMFNVTTDGTTT